MKEDKQQIAIAEACGWTKIHDCEGSLFGLVPEALEKYFKIPDYLNDRNAIIEALNILENPKYTQKYMSNPEYYGWVRFENTLLEILGIQLEEHFVYSNIKDANGERIILGGYNYPMFGVQKMMMATPKQMCEAFLRAIYKWEE